MHIEDQAIERIIEIIKNEYPEFEIFYDKELKESPSYTLSFDNSIIYTIQTDLDIENLEYNSKDKTLDIKSLLQNKKRAKQTQILRAKRKLYDMIKDEDSSIRENIHFLFQQYENQPTILNSLYGTTDEKTYINKSLEENEVWFNTKNEKGLLFNHCLVKFFAKEKVTWYHYELGLCILNLLLNKNLNLLDYSGILPNQLIDGPWFSDANKIISNDLILDDADVLNDGEKHAVYKINDDNYMIISQGDLDVYKTLDSTDFEILYYILNERDRNFFKTSTVFFNIGNIAKILAKGHNPSKIHYKMALDRLDYISRVHIRHFNREFKQTDIYSFLSDIKIDHETYQASAKVSDVIVQDLIKKSITLISKEVIHQLSIPLSKRLIVILQKQRLICYYNTSSCDKKMSQTFDYNFFASVILFKNRSAKKNINNILTVLAEIKSTNTIVKDYILNPNNTITIDFFPLTNGEINDLNYHQQTIDDLKELTLTSE